MGNKQWDTLWVNGLLATCEPGDLCIPESAIAVKAGKIAWVGKYHDLPGLPEALADVVYDVTACTITPGLIDCHTHIVYAGHRAHEFEQRLQGVTYADIAKAGGGIQKTVRDTRAVSAEELFDQSLPRARALLSSGVTTLEVKSGYGLDWSTELKILQVAKRLEKTLPVSIQRTFLGAHTLPPEFRQDADGYIDLVCDEMIPMIAKDHLAEAVDVFCENIAFTLAQTERVFAAAKKNGLAIKCHAEQLSNSGAAALAAKYQAISVDHLEYLSEDGVKAIAASGTVAVLLPGAFYFLRETHLPPIALLRRYRVPIAIATDCNPGTSPVLSLLTIMNMACTLFRMTPMEALAGVTRHAAQALGLAASVGTLSVGKIADLAIWNTADPVELTYYLGHQPLKQLVKRGVSI